MAGRMTERAVCDEIDLLTTCGVGSWPLAANAEWQGLGDAARAESYAATVRPAVLSHPVPYKACLAGGAPPCEDHETLRQWCMGHPDVTVGTLQGARGDCQGGDSPLQVSRSG